MRQVYMVKIINVPKLFFVCIFLLSVAGALAGLALMGEGHANKEYPVSHFIAAGEQEPAETHFTENDGLYSVIRVIDGDTIEVARGGEPTTIRLIGIDSPEVVDPRKAVQCFGIEASVRAKELLNRKKVRLEKDMSQDERDKYGRTLRYVFLQDGTFFNKLMISDGYAREYTYRNHQYIYQHEFEEAQREAREQKMGLWKDGVCANTF